MGWAQVHSRRSNDGIRDNTSLTSRDQNYVLRQMTVVNRIGGTSSTSLRCGLMVKLPAVNRSIVGSTPTA